MLYGNTAVLSQITTTVKYNMVDDLPYFADFTFYPNHKSVTAALLRHAVDFTQ